MMQTRGLLDEALRQYQRSVLNLALDGFGRSADDQPEDQVAKVYAERVVQLQRGKAVSWERRHVEVVDQSVNKKNSEFSESLFYRLMLFIK